MRNSKRQSHDPFRAYIQAFRATPTEYRKALRAARRARKLSDKRWNTGGPFNAGKES